MMSTLFAMGLAASSSAVVLALLLRMGASLPLDVPNARSLHRRPVPRIGGIGIVAGIAAAAVAGFSPAPVALWLALLLACVSFLDDCRGLPVVLRLGVHLSAAAVFVAVELSGMSLPVLILIALAIVWMTNLFNFMDGSDGYAGGMAVFGFGGYAAAATMTGAGDLATLGACVAAAAGGFLIFNLPPARTFLGDSGSIPLGFLAGAVGVIGWRQNAWPAWLPVVLFSPFVFDASVTLARRMLAREKFWLAHNDHFYQRLIRMGWSHLRVALGGYGLMLGALAVSLVGLRLDSVAQAALIAAWCLLLAMLAWMTGRAWRRRTEARA